MLDGDSACGGAVGRVRRSCFDGARLVLRMGAQGEEGDVVFVAFGRLQPFQEPVAELLERQVAEFGKQCGEAGYPGRRRLRRGVP